MLLILCCFATPKLHLQTRSANHERPLELPPWPDSAAGARMQGPTLSWLEDELQAATAPTPASGGAAPTTLDLSNRPLTHASLRLLPGTLTCLDLTRCGMESLEALARLPRLELLNVSYNRLVSLDALQHSRGLKVLFARSNRISSLAALESLSLLQSLDLECNALDTLDALRPLRTEPHTVWARRRGPQSHPLLAPPESSPACVDARPEAATVCVATAATLRIQTATPCASRLWRLPRLAELRLRGNLLPLAAYRRACAQLPSLALLDGDPVRRGGVAA